MPSYYVNRNEQPNGDHEVHEDGACPYPPDHVNRLGVGWHLNCSGAVVEARKTYAQVNGCYYCCNACHTG